MDGLLQYLGESQGDFLQEGFEDPCNLSGLISASLDDAEYRALISAKPARSGSHPGQKGEPIYTVELIFHCGKMPSEYPLLSDSGANTSTSPLDLTFPYIPERVRYSEVIEPNGFLFSWPAAFFMLIMVEPAIGLEFSP